MSQADPLSAT